MLQSSFIQRQGCNGSCVYEILRREITQTRGPWATSLTSETISNLLFKGEKPIISFFIMKWSLFVKPWVPFTQGCLKASLVEIDPMVRSGEEDFQILSMYFCHLVIISPWNRAWPFIWKNLNPLHPRDWLKLAQWFWRRFSNFVNVFSPFRNYLPMEMGVTLYFNKLESPLP